MLHPIQLPSQNSKFKGFPSHNCPKYILILILIHTLAKIGLSVFTGSIKIRIKLMVEMIYNP